MTNYHSCTFLHCRKLKGRENKFTIHFIVFFVRHRYKNTPSEYCVQGKFLNFYTLHDGTSNQSVNQSNNPSIYPSTHLSFFVSCKQTKTIWIEITYKVTISLYISEKTILTYIFTNTSFKFKLVSFTTSDSHILYSYEPKRYTTHWDQQFHFHCYLLLVYDLETWLATKFAKTNELHHTALSFHHTNLHTSAYVQMSVS